MSKKKNNAPKIHKDLQGLEIEIDRFGKIKGSVNIDKINAFLDKNLEDKKINPGSKNDTASKKQD